MSTCLNSARYGICRRFCFGVGCNASYSYPSAFVSKVCSGLNWVFVILPSAPGR